MAKDITVDIAGGQEAIRRIQSVLADWQLNGANAMEAMYGIMDQQQSDTTPWLGMVMDDIASKRSVEITEEITAFHQEMRDYLAAFTQEDMALAGQLTGGVSHGGKI